MASTTARTWRSLGADASTKQSVMTSWSLTSRMIRSEASLSAAATTAASASSMLRAEAVIAPQPAMTGDLTALESRLRMVVAAQDHHDVRDVLALARRHDVTLRQLEQPSDVVADAGRRHRVAEDDDLRCRVVEVRRVAAS